MTFDNFLSPLIPLFKSVTDSHGLNYADSQDAIQEATICLWKKFSSGKLDLNKNTKAYAIRLINWRAKDVCRLKKKSAEIFSVVSEDNDLDLLAAPTETPRRAFPVKILSLAKKRLKPRDYAIFIDHFVRGKPVNETAKKFGLDNAMVYMVRCRSLKKIKNNNKNVFTKSKTSNL